MVYDGADPMLCTRHVSVLGFLALACSSVAEPAVESVEPVEPAHAQATATAPAVPRAPVGVVPSGPPPAEVARMLADVEAVRLRRYVDTLARFGTRHTLSETRSAERGIGAARRFIEAELQLSADASGRKKRDAMRIELERHKIEPDGRRIDRPVEIVNVLAVLPGAMRKARDRRYYLIAHYDSRGPDIMDAAADAPGANDNGSGVAIVLELARVMAMHRFDSTVVLMATDAEEQGLFGARRHAKLAQDNKVGIRAVLNNDIVGDPTGPADVVHRDRIRVFSDGMPGEFDAKRFAAVRRLAAASDSSSRQLARFISTVAAWHGTAVQPMLVFRRDRFMRGGDHTPFDDAGFPAVRLTEVEERPQRQHAPVLVEDGVQHGDLPQFVDTDYLADVARLNLVALAHLANAPSVPRDARIIFGGAPSTTTLRWSASPEPDVAGYEVLWRETTSPTWQHARDVGDVTEATVPLGKDNWFIGVRAYDEAGYRSPVAFPTVGRN